MYWSRALSLMCEVAFSSPHAHFLSYLNGYLVYYKLIYIHPHRASHGGRRLPLISVIRSIRSSEDKLITKNKLK